MTNLTFKESLALMDDLAFQLDTSSEKVHFEASPGRVLAEPLFWDRHHPPYHRAAMDGYAFSGAPEIGVRFFVIGVARAGEAFGGTIPNQACIKIATGAQVPSGLDTVIPWEKTRFEDEWVEVQCESKPGENVHLMGSDQRSGEIALPQGHLVRPQDLALLSTIGAEFLSVRPKVQVSFLSTGSELVSISENPAPDHIRASNYYQIKYLLDHRPSVNLVHHDFIEDRYERLLSFMKRGLKTSELIIITGGVGTSEYDHVPRLASELDFHTIFHGLAIKPGHPLFLAQKGNQFILGLPGNPISSLACYTMFAQRMLRHLQGLKPIDFPLFIAGQDLVNKGRRTLMRPVRMVGKEVFPVLWNGSGDVSAISQIQGLALIKPQSLIESGSDVTVVLLEDM